MAAVPIPLLFAALTGRSGPGLAPYGPRCPPYSLGLLVDWDRLDQFMGWMGSLNSPVRGDERATEALG